MSPSSGTGRRPATPQGTGPNGTITRDDLASQLSALRGDVQEQAQAAKGIGIAVAVGIVALAVIGAYVSGRRRGKRRSTIVEIRRI